MCLTMPLRLLEISANPTLPRRQRFQLHCPQTVRLFRSVTSTATFVQFTRNVNGPTEFLAAAESHCEPSINFLFEKNESTTVLLRHVFGFAKKSTVAEEFGYYG